MKEITVEYGLRELRFSIPEKNLVNEVDLLDSAPITDVRNALLRSFSNPIGTLPFNKIVTSGDDIAVIVDDHTRDIPTRDILETLCPELEKYGILRDDITIVVATGSHRSSNATKLARKIFFTSITTNKRKNYESI